MSENFYFRIFFPNSCPAVHPILISSYKVPRNKFACSFLLKEYFFHIAKFLNNNSCRPKLWVWVLNRNGWISISSPAISQRISICSTPIGGIRPPLDRTKTPAVFGWLNLFTFQFHLYFDHFRSCQNFLRSCGIVKNYPWIVCISICKTFHALFCWKICNFIFYTGFYERLNDDTSA